MIEHSIKNKHTKYEAKIVKNEGLKTFIMSQNRNNFLRFSEFSFFLRLPFQIDVFG